MAERTRESDSKENIICSICYEKSKFKYCEDIEKGFIMNLKSQTRNSTPELLECRQETRKSTQDLECRNETGNSTQDLLQCRHETRNSTQDLLECRNASENNRYINKEIVMKADETTPQKKNTKKHPEIQNIKEFVSEQLQNIIKIVIGFENTLSFYNKKYDEMIITLAQKLECIQKLETQNSRLRCDLDELSRRLYFVEQNCIHVKIEQNYKKLGQQLNVDFTTPPRLYNTDFQVRDHKMSGGVWLYNNRDNNSNVDGGLAASTEYFSTESPGKSATLTGIQLAPGGERRKSTTEAAPKDSVDELQRRLDNLRGFNS